ncbi:unnamed protein product, partial [Mesocestoides corti]
MVVVAVVVIIAIVVGFVFWRRRSVQRQGKGEQDRPGFSIAYKEPDGPIAFSAPVSNPVNVTSFAMVLSAIENNNTWNNLFESGPLSSSYINASYVRPPNYTATGAAVASSQDTQPEY